MTWEERWHPLREEWVIIAAHSRIARGVGETVEHNEGETPVSIRSVIYARATNE